MKPGTEAMWGCAKTASAAAMAAAMLVFAPSAYAQDAETEAANPNRVSLGPIPSLSTDADTTWYEDFTLSLDEATTLSQLNAGPSTFQLQAPNGRWGITLGVEDHPFDEFQIEDMSAGAFFNLGDRFRFSGEFRFTSPEEDLFLTTEREERAPEIKFESALRF